MIPLFLVILKFRSTKHLFKLKKVTLMDMATINHNTKSTFVDKFILGTFNFRFLQFSFNVNNVPN